jgi:5-methylcytosine-specific restriction endonuclease McrA
MWWSLFQRNIRYAVRSPKWKSLRNDHLKEQPECQACGKDYDLEVHHIVPVHVAEELELDPENLITLCSKCHLVFGHLYSYKSWNQYVVKDAEAFFKKVKRRP